MVRQARPSRPLDRFNIPLDEYPRRCVAQIAGWDAERSRLEGGGVIDVQRSFEYAATIIRSIETGKPRVVYGNVANEGLIDDLPDGCTVEVPCLVDGNGVQPTRIGALPPQLAALIRTNVNVQELTVEAALTGQREHVYHAAMLDRTPRPSSTSTRSTPLVEARARSTPTAIGFPHSIDVGRLARGRASGRRSRGRRWGSTTA